MNEKTNPGKSAIQFGILFGVIMILELVISYVLDIDPTTNKNFGIILNLLNFLILPVSLIWFGCQNYKIKLNNGFISLGECLKIGVFICVIASVIYSVFAAGFNLLIPEYMEDVLKKMRTMMLKESPDMKAEQVDMAIGMIKKFSNPIISIPITILMYSFFGMIFSLIIGAITKNEKPQSF
jgi:Protein of unknown function (DUF4199)